MSDKDDDYTSILLEQLVYQNKAILEAVTDMQKNFAKIPSIEETVSELKQDIKVSKAAVTDMSN